MTRPPDQADAKLVAEVIDAGADQRTRAAVRAAEAVDEARAAGKDPRAASVRVTRVLAEAGRLKALAEGLRDGLLVLTEAATATATTLAGVPVVADPDHDHDPGTATVRDAVSGEVLATITGPLGARVATVDDGTSPEAKAAAELAGLKPTDETEDPITGATDEDEPDADDVDEVAL